MTEMLTAKSPVIAICYSLIVFVVVASSSAAEPMATLLETAAATHKEATTADIAEARQALSRDVRNLRRLLELTPGNIAGWEKYLKLQELEQHLRSPQPGDISILKAVVSRFSSDQSGLGMREFVALRGNLKFYLTLLQDADNPNAGQRFAEQIAGLRSAIESCNQNPQQQSFDQIAAHVGWLTDRRQAGQLIQVIRKRYSHRNLHVSISQRLISGVIDRDIDETTPFNSSLSGATVSGTARTRGTVTSALVPNDKRASVAISFKADSELDTTAVRKPVQVYATGNVNSTAWSQIDIDGNGFTFAAPHASASASVCVYSIQTGLPWPAKPLVTGIARQVVRNKQDAVNQSAAQSAERELESQMQKQIDDIVGPLNRQYRQDVVRRLRRIDAFPADIAVSTTKDRLHVDLLVASEHQLGAPVPVTANNATADVSLQVHQSAVNNIAASMLGGKTFTIREIQELAEDLLGIPAPAESVSEAEKISITFDDHRPVAVQFGEDTVTLSIVGREFIANRRTYPPMSVSITYQFKSTPDGFQANQVGEPVIVPPRLETAERKSLSLRETAIRRILRNRLDRDLNKQVDIGEIPLPAKLENIPPLSVTQLTSAKGWLTLSVLQQPAQP